MPGKKTKKAKKPTEKPPEQSAGLTTGNGSTTHFEATGGPDEVLATTTGEPAGRAALR